MPPEETQAGEGAGQQDAGTKPGTETGQETPEQIEARLRAEAARDVDRYRNEAGQANKRLREMEQRLQQIEDEKKPELQRLTDAAGQVPLLQKEIESRDERLTRYEAAFEAQNDAAKKLLEKLDKGLLTLIPEGLSPDQEFNCLRNAVNKAQADAEKGRTSLPPGGGRNPGTAGDKKEPTDAERAAAAQHYATRF
jgi:flagellar biosynthesis chaperone FliJ